MSLMQMGKKFMDRFMGGRGDASITVPVLDGPLKPNDLIEEAALIVDLEAVDNLIAMGEKILMTSGRVIWQLDAKHKLKLHSEYESEITCLAVGPNGVLAVGLHELGVKIIGGRFDGRLFFEDRNFKLNCITAMVFDGEECLFVTNGSKRFSASMWQYDLLSLGHSGSVIRLDCKDGAFAEIAGGLKYPSGICILNSKNLIVSEAWAHRLLSIAKDGSSAAEEVLAALPAYPGRITASSTGGYWLNAFAIRSQLQEFILREDDYRQQMMVEVDSEYWIAPALSSGHSFKEPLQAGGVIRLGIQKPWAPSRSYGLIIHLNQDLMPIASAHSRAGGLRHGITSSIEVENKLYFTSKGAGELLSISVQNLEQEGRLAEIGESE